MNTSKLIWVASASGFSASTTRGDVSWAPLPAPIVAMSGQQQTAVQNFYRLAYARAQAQVAQKQEQFRELVADVDFERATRESAHEESRFRVLTEGIDFGGAL
jgi:hypothetical protein